ncbi:MAG: Gfo/Idh/MocA family oxidoreductase [Planctomycetes bacterium]|nr:Gfo/Idh/MocA family oxidoreductase [Planctomycetota bacterium]
MCPAPRNQGSRMPEDIHLALIGAGRHGRDLLNYCLDIPGVRFRAVCDIWPYSQRYAAGILKRRGQPVAVYEDYRDMLSREKDLHAAIIATPDVFHPEQAVACLRAGLHVYLEKEMAITVEGARQVVRAARETGRLVQVGRQHRSNPRYHAAYEFIHEKQAVGRITNVFAQWHGHKRVPYKWPEKEAIPPETLRRYGYNSMDEHRNWRWFARFSAGELVNLGAHQIDVLNWFLRAVPKGVMASGGLDYYDFYDLHDVAQCVLEWDFTWDGATKTVRGAERVNTTTDHGGFYEVFQGDQGYLEISEDSNKGGLCRNTDAPLRPWEPKDAVTAIVARPAGPSVEILPDLDKLTDPVIDLDLRPPSWEWMKTFRRYPPIKAANSDKPVHWYHLKNFFDAVRGEAKLTCPAEVGLQGAVSALKAVEAMALGRRLDLRPEDFIA